MLNEEYIFRKVFKLAERFEGSEDPRRKRIGASLAGVAEFIMGCEKLERQECGWTEQEVIETIANLLKEC